MRIVYDPTWMSAVHARGQSEAGRTGPEAAHPKDLCRGNGWANCLSEALSGRYVALLTGLLMAPPRGPFLPACLAAINTSGVSSIKSAVY
jgi:hypothetical protein